MSLSSIPESQTRIPFSRPTLSLSGLRWGNAVREIITTRVPRRKTMGAQSTSDDRTESEPRHSISNFPDLVQEILQRARAAPSTPERILDEAVHVPHIQSEGKKEWEEFQGHATALEKDLQKFQDAVQELGSSLHLTRAARTVRENISLISQILQENARKLFPRVTIPQKFPRVGSRLGRRRTLSQRLETNAHFNSDQGVEVGVIYVRLKLLAHAVEYLRRALEQFPEFRNVDVWPLICFEGDLKYWSSVLEHYKDQLETREVRSYVHNLSRELGAMFEDTSLCLKEFIDGVPTARLSQKHAMSTLQSLATVATFFSAVTAATIQFSYGKNDNTTEQAVNVFWFSSLVCSIASALNSFLVLTWRKANYSPSLGIPWWLWFWIRQSPIVFLFASVATFLAGLGCFAVSSNQTHLTFVIVIILEAISAFGLAGLLVWLAYDKWSFYHHSPKQLPIPGVPKILENTDSALVSPSRHTTSWHFPAEPEKPDLATESVLSLTRTTTDLSTALTSVQRAERAQRARRRWKSALRDVTLVLRGIKAERRREYLEALHMENMDPRLRRLVVSDELKRPGVGADTSDIQFDPRGRFLAVCGKTPNMRFDLGSAKTDEFPLHIGRARQMVWTSTGEHLMIRTSQTIHVWKMSSDIVLQSSIMWNDILRYILSVPNSEVTGLPKILAVQGTQANKLVIVDTLERVYMTQLFREITIQHIDITPDGTRTIFAAMIPDAVDGIEPMKASPARKLIVFNLRTRQVENQVPLWYDVQGVTMSENGKWVVVSYKDYPPPQLWHLHGTPNGIRLSLDRQFCAREQVSAYEFNPSQNIRYVGRAHFANRDRYVLCTTADGKIHIWRRDKPHPVHIHGGLTLDKNKPVQIACSKGHNDFMFATRSHNGTVRIWKIPNAPTIEIETPGQPGTEPIYSLSRGMFQGAEPITESPQKEQPPAL